MRRRVSLFLLALTALLLLGTSPASAIDLNPFNGHDCTPDAGFSTPATGPANAIDPGPAHPKGGNPFAKHPKVSIYEAYGWGASWPTFSCSMKSDMLGGVADPAQSATGAIANVLLGDLSTALAFTTAVLRFAFSPGTLNIFNPVMRLAADALGKNVFHALFWITLCATGILLAYRAFRARFADAARDAGWIVFVGVLALCATLWPLVVAPVVDNALTGTIGAVNTQLAHTTGSPADTAADGTAANLQHSLVYETWCSGMLGRGAGKEADKWCPKLWEATHFRRDELAKIDHSSDPASAFSDEANGKQQGLKVIADQIKKEDPTAYSYLIGQHNTDRIGYALLGWFGFLCASPFLLMSAFLILFALIVVRLAIMLIPAVAVIAGFPAMRHHMTNLLDYTVGAVFTALMFGCLSAVFIAAIGGFMSPHSGVPTLLAMVLLGIATIAAWKFSKPIRRFKHLGNVPRAWRGRGRAADTADWDGDGVPDGQQKAAASEGGIFTPSGRHAYADATPAEASPSLLGSATKGAAAGAASTAILGLVSGGTVTAGAMAAGAARGAVVAGAGSKMGTVGALAADSAIQGLGSSHSPAPAAVASAPAAATPAAAPAAPSAPTPRGLPAGSAPAPAPTGEAKARVYRPGEATPAEGLRVVEPTTTAKGERVYQLYTPEPKGANL